MIAAVDQGPQREDLWTGDEMRRLLHEAAVRLIGTSLTIATWRHLAIAIARRYLHILNLELLESSNGSCDGQDNEDGDEEDLYNNIWDLEAAHSTDTAEMVYGRQVQQGSDSATRQVEFWNISQLWHRFLGF